MTQPRVTEGRPDRLGAIADEDGVDFAVFSANADRMELCLFDEAGAETTRLTLPERTGAIWHGRVDGLRPGALYGYRAYGPYAPEHGHRFNHHKLLADPYAREFRGAWTDHPATLGYDPKAPDLDLSFSRIDSAPHVPKSVVSHPDLFTAIAPRPDRPAAEALIYEAHVKGLTQMRPAVPEAVRGTYEGLAAPAMIDHLLRLGVDTVELLPVHAFIDDGFLRQRGLRNYWGYNSIGFFAPEPRYFGPQGLAGFRAMVDALHGAGIRVILDVVYNHTAEGDQRGPTLSFRGLDNASYYRLIAGRPRYYVNDTGCGNTLNVAEPHVLRMVMDSLRFWVAQMGVDGFRFDLATVMGREPHGFDSSGGFFDAIRQDPVLAGATLIAEPWDLGPGGYQLGAYPPEFGEWNDTFRDTVRRYWKGDAHSAQDLGARLLGSADHFDRAGRPASASINFVTAHDGFTLADLTRYADRHNEVNGEGGADGHHANHSDNCGVEGETDDPEITARRQRRARNILATLFLSQGRPMLLAGDEIGNSQGGNNNAYCQDNEIGWLNWGEADEAITEFVAALSAFRRSHRTLRQSRFLHGAPRMTDGLPDVEWTDFDGAAVRWRDPMLSNFCLTVRGSAETTAPDRDHDAVFIVFNRDEADAEVAPPAAPPGWHWVRAVDTAATDVFQVCELTPGRIAVAGHSVVALVQQPDEPGA